MRAPRRLASGKARATLMAAAQVRARDAEADLGSNGLGALVTVRQRNVEAQGFPAELAGAADGVFLDLPSPWLVRAYPLRPLPFPTLPYHIRTPTRSVLGGRRGGRAPRGAPPLCGARGATGPARRPWRASCARAREVVAAAELSHDAAAGNLHMCLQEVAAGARLAAFSPGARDLG